LISTVETKSNLTQTVRLKRKLDLTENYSFCRKKHYLNVKRHLSELENTFF